MTKSMLLVLATLAVAGCGKSNDAGGAASAAASGAAATTSTAAGTAAPASDACDPKDIFKPTPVKSAFAWSQTPAIGSAPVDLVASVGGEPFKLESVEVWTNKKNGDWELRVRGGPVGPSLIFKGAPKVGVTEEKWGSNKGYFQVPQKGTSAATCGRQTTSYNGSNARVVKLTKYDEKSKTADGTFVTTWEESFGDKRKFWAGGTFKDAKVLIFN